MNSSPETIEIRNLFASLNQHNYDSVVTELSHYIEYGIDVSILLGEICFECFTTYKQDLKSTHLQPAICTLFKKLMEKPHFSVVFSSLVKDTSVSKEFLDNLSCTLQLSGFEKLGIGLALLDSENNDVKIAGTNFCMSWCKELREKSEVLSKHADVFRKLILQIFEPQSVLTPSVAMDFSSDYTTPSQAVNSFNRETFIDVPSIEIQETISSMMYYLTPDNIDETATDFTAILAERYYPWFAQYLLMERASLEPNFHMLCIKFLERTSSKPLNKEIVRASYEKCKVVLNPEIIKSSTASRQFLKNLGGWLGKLTIGRNQALLAKHIDPKSLLLKAYEEGLLIGVIPFIAKIMEACESSVAYKPPNVWTMAILGLLFEIYAMENLSVELKEEIEVLLEKLKVGTTNIDPTSLLKNRVRIIEENPDFTVRSAENQPVDAGTVYEGGLTSYQQHPFELHHARPANYYSNWEQFHPPDSGDGAPPVTFYPNLPEQGNIYAWERFHHEYDHPFVPQQILPGLNLTDDTRPAIFSLNLLVQGNTCARWEPNSEHVRSFLPQQIVVKEFAWHHPRQMNSDVFSPGLRNSRSMGSTSITIKHPLTTSAALDEFQILSQKLENLIVNEAKEAEIKPVIAEVLAIIPKCKSKDDAAIAVAQKVFESLYENDANTKHVDARLVILSAICDDNKLVGQELTSWVLHSGSDDKKFNKDVTVGLIRKKLLNLPEYTIHMAKLIEAQKSDTAAKFAISLVETLKTSDDKVISEFQHMLDALAEVAKHSEASRKAESSEPDFHEQVTSLLAEWCRIRVRYGTYDAAPCADYVLQLHQYILSKDDNTLDSFFCIFLELAVSHYLSSERNNLGPEEDSSSTLHFDICVDLVFSILKFYPHDQGTSKLFLLYKVLAAFVKFITKDARENMTSFCPRPYFRLFINFFLHCDTLYSDINDANFKVLIVISDALHALQPLKVPSFCFVWLELVSHRCFMPKLLLEDDKKGWPYFHRLLVDFLQFMEPLLTTGELKETVLVLYKGTLRVLVLLAHDFPDFLSYYHFSLCDVVAPNCVQMRNIILSAFPSNISKPDPKTPISKVNMLPEMSQPPYISSNFDAALEANKMKTNVDEYLNTREKESSFLSQLKTKLLLPLREAERSGTCYNVSLMNSLVLYVGTKAIQQLEATTTPPETSVGSCDEAALKIFNTLILDLDSEGRYYFFNAVANQLRYPNNHTRYFSSVILNFFTEINQEAVQEQITRILLERVITLSPRPWGARVTALQLITDPRYSFSNLNLTKYDPEMESIFKYILNRLMPKGNRDAK